MSEQNKVFQQLQKKFSTTYYYSTRLFPREIRENVQVLYAFLRLPDEIVDNPTPGATAQEIWSDLEKFEQKTLSAIESADFDNSDNLDDLVIQRFSELARQFHFEKKWINAFFKSMKMDLIQNRYASYADLQEYVYGSAGVVGLMMNRLMGGTVEGDQAAENLGTAMQLTNFIRDLKEDYLRGRIYFPLQDFQKFSLSESDFPNGSSKNYFDFINFQIDRIKNYYEEVFNSANLIPKSSRLPVLTASFVYYDVLERIAKHPEQLWSKDFKKTFRSFPKAIWRSYQIINKNK